MSNRLTHALATVVLVVATGVVSQSSIVHATVPSPFDNAFGTNGAVIQEIPPQKSDSFASDIVANSSGDIFTLYIANQGTPNEIATIGKYTNNGVPLTAFGVNGRTTELSVVNANFLLQTDGKILIYGFDYSNSQSNIVVYRLTASGRIDTTFASSGAFKQASFPGKQYGGSQVFLAVNPNDGRIHLGFDITNSEGNNQNFYFITLDSSGLLDFNWGSGAAREVIPRTGPASAWSALTSMKILSDGSLIGIGSSIGTNGARQIVLVKINANGYLDITFDGTSNGNGIIFVQFASETDAYMTAPMVTQSDEIVLAGLAGTYYSGPMYYGITRILANGLVDTTFGENGFTLSSLQGGFDTPLPKRLAVQSDGRYVFPINSGTTAGFMRIESNGAISSTPNCSACLWAGANDGAQATSLIVQSDDKVVVTGMHRTEKNSLVRRFESSGTSDGTFNNVNLQLNLQQWSAYVNKSIPLSNGGIVSTGTATLNMGFGFINRAIVFKFTAAGSLDTQFGMGGYRFLSPPTNGFSLSVNGFIIQADGKIVVLGSGREDNNVDMSIMLWRINADGTVDNSFGDEGFVITSDPDAQLSPNSIFQTSDGKFLIPLVRGEDFTGSQWIYRYSNSGELDPTYTDAQNFPGGIRLSVGDGTGFINFASLTTNDALYISGLTIINSFSHAFVARVLSNGTLDSSFSNGYVTWPTQQQNSLDYVAGTHIDQEGKIYLLGPTMLPTSRTLIIQLNSSGERNLNFNGTGFLAFNFQDPLQVDSQGASDFTLTNNGFTIVGSGDSDTRRNKEVSFSAVSRITASGTLDIAFGTNGVLLPLPDSVSYFADIAPIANETSLISGGIEQNGIMKLLLMKIGPTAASSTTTTPTTTVPPTTTAPPVTTTIPVSESSLKDPTNLIVTVSQAALLKKANLVVPPGGKVSMKSATPKVCRVVKLKVQALNTGTCRVSITITVSKKVKAKKTLSLKVS